MIKIPGQQRQFSQPNNSDLFGNVWYTKNINFDEEGYIKLSPRQLSIINSTNNTDLGSISRIEKSLLGYYVFSDNTNYYITYDSDYGDGYVTDDDTNAPTGSGNDGQLWSGGIFYAMSKATLGNTKLLKNTGTWADSGVAASNFNFASHFPVDVFITRDTICIGNANKVTQITSSDTVDTALTLPSNYSINDLAYSNNLMGIIVSTAYSLESVFVTWDGTATSANAFYKIGATDAMEIAAYKNSWVILTLAGELKYFTGGGFQSLGFLPVYYSRGLWRNQGYSKMNVLGDTIYFHINSNLSLPVENNDGVLLNSPAGFLCYDPKVGIYHKESPSLTAAVMIAVASTDVSTSTNTLTSSTIAGSALVSGGSAVDYTGGPTATGSPIKYLKATTPIGGLSFGTVYYVINDSSTEFKLATTKANALNGTAIDLTSAGSGNHLFVSYEPYDYGATYVAETYGVIHARPALSSSTINQLVTNLMTASRLYDGTSTVENVSFSSSGFENRGYFVTPKILSNTITDAYNVSYIKYRPLVDSDVIIVKAKTQDIDGLPVSTVQNTTGNKCTYTSATTFTTSVNLAKLKTAFDNGADIECEIIAGAGAGQMEQVTDITVSSGTYTITVANNIVGAVADNMCSAIFDNWTIVTTITADNQNAAGYTELPLSSIGKWIKVKVELRGDETTVEELQIANQPRQS